MGRNSAVFQAAGRRLEADTCEPLVAATEAGEIRLEALVRGAYPGRPLPPGILPQVSTIGYWDAPCDQSWGLEEHRNEGIEITYLDNGHLGFVVDGQSHPLSPGHLTITRPWQPHRVGDPHVAASRLYWLILDVGVRQPHQVWQWPPWLVLSPDDLRELTALLRENEHPVWPGTPEIGRCFADIGHLIESSRPGRAPSSRLALMINELLVCLLELLRTQDPPRTPSLTLGERSVSMFLDQLARELNEPWTLDAMAERTGLKRTRFAHHCRRLTNLSPMSFLQHLRIEEAKRLLADTDESVTDIAMRCGFSTSAYFATVFREWTNCAPRDYRATSPRS